MQIYKGLTFNNGNREVNVHGVENGVVHWCAHPLNNDESGSLYKSDIYDFELMAFRALENPNVTCYSLLTHNATELRGLPDGGE